MVLRIVFDYVYQYVEVVGLASDDSVLWMPSSSLQTFILESRTISKSGAVVEAEDGDGDGDV